MQKQLSLIREAIALAQKELVNLKEQHKTDGMAEVDELEMGLEWSMKRVQRLEVLVRIDSASMK